MDPSLPPPADGRGRLPRARGDGPGDPSPRCVEITASPRSRGWTVAGVRWPLLGDGLPRARGDGPDRVHRDAGGREASPRSRGWTQLAQEQGHALRGFPALAGMDPGALPRTMASAGLPRARGDGPRSTTKRVISGMASPRSRGWTPAGSPRWTPRSGFPALAGMDREDPPDGLILERLPRARGDGPSERGTYSLGSGASPRSRGWTRNFEAHLLSCLGFPALAGMDPRRATSTAGRPRLPRARGDGPVEVMFPLAVTGASPRSRGWTPFEPRPADVLSGFPALAGMDPSRPRRSTRPLGLPRARGDGPTSTSDDPADPEASPRSRGWTPTRGAVGRLPSGFPALAGMDPSPLRTRTPRERLPRARGDGPVAQGRTPHPDEASPRSRGWTRRPGPRAAPGRGFPALAGMDPDVEHRFARPFWLPRARGDGPAVEALVRITRRASPRSRGWTQPTRPAMARQEGFPALAGMDPAVCFFCWLCYRLPRARGDGPPPMAAPPPPMPASPRSRGWTRPVPLHPRRLGGFPALAGMDRRPASRSRPAARLPRARGDGPRPTPLSPRTAAASPRSRGWTQDLDTPPRHPRGFPALAGMDLSRSRSSCRSAGLPRARGDGPPTRPGCPACEPASPRSRGWTPHATRRRRRLQGFPALAGMDPGSPRFPLRRRGLPRARGDGPERRRANLRLYLASPRSRGWTSEPHHHRAAAEGFPALAGMDPPDPASSPPPRRLPRARGDGPSAGTARQS